MIRIPAIRWCKVVFALGLIRGLLASSLADDGLISVSAIAGHDRFLQLHIGWDRSLNEHDSSSGELYVSTNNASSSCPVIDCGEHINKTVTKLLVPEKLHSIVEPRNCEFYPGCSYTIHLHFHSKSLSHSYQIPDCVDHMCKCESKFPDFFTHLEYNQESKQVFFAWNISNETTDDFPLVYFNLKFFNTHDHRRTPFEEATVYKSMIIPLNMTLAEESLVGSAEFEFEYSEQDEPTFDEKIKVEVTLVDNGNCQSPHQIQYFTLRSPKEQETVASSTVVIIVVTSSIVTLIIIIIALIAKCQFKRLHNLVAKICGWKIDYDNISTNTPPMTTVFIPMQENIIYIDKDIIDAKERGEADEYEISHFTLTIGSEIGKGAFGRVFIALANNLDGQGGTATVAVKKLKKRPSEEEMEEFMNEINMMKRVGLHPNIISLLGCCTLKQPLLMVMEYIGKGDLQHYLQAIRSQYDTSGSLFDGNQHQHVIDQDSDVFGDNDQETDSSEDSEEDSSDSDASYVLQREKQLRPSVTETLYTTVSNGSQLDGSKVKVKHVLDHVELQNFALQIAKGMQHLENLGITHRDLATRNILIDENKRLKISDFGLSRSGTYVTTKNKCVPLRWLSIEAIRWNLYSSKSDVWAFGVVLWEIGTLGGFPYQDVRNHELLHYLLQGNRLKQPTNCSDKLYQLMQNCWQEDARKRPTFSDILDDWLHESEQNIYIDFDEMDNDVFMLPEEQQS